MQNKKIKIFNEPEYSRIISLLGGRKFIGVILASVLVFTITIWAMILQTVVLLDVISSKEVSFDSKTILEQLWSFCKTIVPTYMGLLAAYSGLQILQKKIGGNNTNTTNEKENDTNIKEENFD